MLSNRIVLIPELADVDKEIESIPKPECGLHDLLSATVSNISNASFKTSANNHSRVEGWYFVPFLATKYYGYFLKSMVGSRKHNIFLHV